MCKIRTEYCTCCKNIMGADLEDDFRIEQCPTVFCTWRRFYYIEKDPCDDCQLDCVKGKWCNEKQRPLSTMQNFVIEHSEGEFDGEAWTGEGGDQGGKEDLDAPSTPSPCLTLDLGTDEPLVTTSGRIDVTVDLVSSPGANGTFDLLPKDCDAVPAFAVELAVKYPSPRKIREAPNSSTPKFGSQVELKEIPDTPESPHGSHSSEDVDFTSSDEEGRPGAPAKRRGGFFEPPTKRKFCCNEKILSLKCSEAFGLVEQCEGIEATTARYEDTFYPLVVEFVKAARDFTSPVSCPNRRSRIKLKDQLGYFLIKPAQKIEWKPDGEETVGEVFEKAFKEAYSDASPPGLISELYVRRAVRKVAKKLIGCCVRLNGGKAYLAREAVRVNILLCLVSEKVEKDARFKKDCENHNIIAKRMLSFD